MATTASGLTTLCEQQQSSSSETARTAGSWIEVVANAFEAICGKFPDRRDTLAMVTIDGQQISYEKLSHTVAAFREHALAAGIKPRQLLTIEIPNDVVRMCLVFALSSIGAIPILGASAAESIAAGVIPSARLSHQLADVEGCPTVFLNQTWFDNVRSATAKPPYSAKEGETSVVFTSSATTGNKKFMALSHGALLRRLDGDDEILGNTGANRMITVSMAADFGLRNALRTLRHGGVVLGHVDSATRSLELAKKYRINEFVITPLMMSELTEAKQDSSLNLPDLQSIVSAGGPVGSTLAISAAEAFNAKITNVYGATETGLIAVTQDTDWYHRDGDSGKTVPWLTVETVDKKSATDTTRLSEVRVKLDPSFTVENYLGHREVANNPIRGGWFYPGDVGRHLPDRTLLVKGRVDDLINAGGNKLSPTAIEQTLVKTPGIAAVAVVGLRNSTGFDDVGVVICSPQPRNLDILALEFERSLKFPCKIRVVQVPALPKTPAGKLDRIRLRQHFANQ
jgi:acyl-coenzyme A synthetase/AMP-(fatty) acid ligase